MNNIIERIKKLLRLGTSSNPHEAALAIQRAYELAAKHHIDISKLSPDAEESRVKHERHNVGYRLSRQRRLAITVVCRYFFVRCIITYPDVTFIGQPCDIMIARYVFDYLAKECSRMLRDWQGKRKLAWSTRASYIDGFFYGVAHMLDQAKSQHALIHVGTELIKYEQDLFSNSNLKSVNFTIPRRNRDAMSDGFTAGRRTSIRKGVQGKERKAISQ